MKNLRSTLIALLFSLLCAQGAAAQMAVSDTVVIITNAKDINIVNGSGSISVEIGKTGKGNSYSYTATTSAVDSVSSGWDINLPFLNKKHNRFQTLVYPKISYGISALSGISPSALSQKYSDEATLQLVEFCWCPGWNTSFGLGVGISTSRFRFSNALFDSGEGVLTATGIPANAQEAKCHISNFGFNFPLSFHQTIYKSMGFSLSVIANLNTYTTAQSAYKIGDVEHKETFKGLHQKILTVDYRAGLQFDWFEMFAKYSPGHVFKPGYGPDFKRWTFGIAVTIK